MSVVTVDLLVVLGAERSCPQLARFAELFPDGAKITDAAFDRAAEAGLDVAWLAARLLPAPAWAEYERTIDAARAEYRRATAPAWAEYRRATAPAWAEYERATAEARAEYERATAEALKAAVAAIY